MNRVLLPYVRGGFGAGRTVAVDAALWAGLVALAAVQISSAAASGRGGPHPWGQLFLAMLLIGAAVVLSRAYPLAAVCIPVGVGLLQAPANPLTDARMSVTFIVIAVLGYLAGRRLERAKPVLLLVLVSTVVELALNVLAQVAARGAFGVVSGLYGGLVVGLALLFVLVVPWFAGRYRRQRAALSSAGWERAELLERQQRISADRARLRERARIAQDMHDSLGHELNLIALRAAALELASDVGEESRAAAGELRSSVALSAERLREIIGVLRPDGEAAPIEPPRTDIAELVERATASGMAVELEREENTAVDSPVVVDRAACRVVQEALTNAAKHAPGTAVVVRLAYPPDATVVTVTNEPPAQRPGTGEGTGLGLTGLEERVRLLGGSFTAGPCDGGFEVVARFPHTSDAVEADRHDPEAEPDPPVMPTESTQVFDRTRRRVRHGLRTAIAVSIAVGGGVAVIGLGLQLVVGLDNTLAPDDYDRLRAGEQHRSVERVLPPFQLVDVPPKAMAHPPEGAVCEYYWSTRQSEDGLVFRLCFDEDRLVVKDAVRVLEP